MSEWFSNLQTKFIFDFLEKQRYIYIVDGLKITLEVTFLALILGLILGAIVAVVRVTNDQLKEESKRGLGGFLLKLADIICRIYLTVIRGTPVLVQLLLMFFVFLVSPNISKTVVAVTTFGINSGAYVSEIIRAGISSIDKGQMDGGRALGLTYKETMRMIILPQAIKNVMPALGNEFITLLKETSVAGYIGIIELTKAGDIISSRTYNYFFPLIITAIIYLIMTLGLSKIISKFEKRGVKNA